MKNKANIERLGSDLKITMPSGVNWKLPLFSILWFIIWYFAFKFALAQDQLMLDIWLVGWTIAGAFMVVINLWQIFGFEVVLISRDKTVLSIRLFGLGFKRTLQPTRHVICTFTDEEKSKQEKNKRIGYLNNPGTIKFEHFYKTYVIGGGLDSTEAKYLVKVINKEIRK